MVIIHGYVSLPEGIYYLNLFNVLQLWNHGIVLIWTFMISALWYPRSILVTMLLSLHDTVLHQFPLEPPQNDKWAQSMGYPPENLCGDGTCSPHERVNVHCQIYALPDVNRWFVLGEPDDPKCICSIQMCFKFWSESNVTRWLADLYGKSTNGMWIWWFKASATGFQTRTMSAPCDSMAQEYNSMNPSKMNLVFFKDDGSHLEEELIPKRQWQRRHFLGDFKVGALSDKSQSYCEMPGMSRWKEFSDLLTPSHVTWSLVNVVSILIWASLGWAGYYFFCEREGECDTQIEKTICWLQACPCSAVPKCYFRVGDCTIQSYDSRCLQCFVWFFSGGIHFCRWHVSFSIHLGRCVVLCFEHWIVVTNRLFLLQVSRYSHWYVVIFVPANIGYPKKQMVITLSRHWPVNLFHPGVLTILTYDPVRIPVNHLML